MTVTCPYVLFISPQPFFAWRGSPLRVANDVEALVRLGYAVDLLTLPMGEPRDIPGVRILRVGRIPGIREVPIGPSLGKLLYDALLLIRGLRLVIRRRYDVIHGIEEAGLIAWILGRLSGAAVVYEKHSDPASHRDGRLRNLVLAAYARVERLMVSGADAVIGTGLALVEQVRAMNPRKAVFHVFDIPSSRKEPDPRRADKIRAGLIRAPGERIALYAGSFAPYQGLDLLFDAMLLVFRARPDVRLAIIGGAEAESAARREWLAARGVEDRVSFVGFVPPDELPEYLRAADILLSPRVSGVNSPLKLLDYLKAGRAIVATNLPANREVVDESCAVMVEPDAAAFAAAVERLASSPEWREKLGAAGRRRIDETYHMDGFVNRIRACYAALPPAKPRPDGRSGRDVAGGPAPGRAASPDGSAPRDA